MARLDQLGPAKSTAQLGATIGREFPAALLRAVTPLDEDLVRQDLKQLVDAELLYQRGVGATAMYQFKHALIQDAAYQSLLKSTRQQYHQRIAQVLAERFPETAETQPALVAQHYTAAGLHAQALPYWQRAGQLALERSAYREAVASLEQALEAAGPPATHPRAHGAGRGSPARPAPCALSTRRTPADFRLICAMPKLSLRPWTITSG